MTSATNASLTLNNVQPGNAATYQVVVTNLYGSVRSSNAVLSVVPGPPNDMFAQRISILGTSNLVSVSSMFGTKEPGEPDHGGNVGGSSVWWTWTAPTNGTVTAKTAGSSFDTVLAIYVGSVLSNLTLIADDNGFGGYGGYRDYYSSVVEFTAVQGTAYQLAVDGYYGASGNVLLSLQEGTFVQPTNGTPPLELNASVQGNLLVLSFNGSVGQTYTVQYINGLNAGSWLVLTNVTAVSTNVVCYDTITNSPRRFYRISPALSVAPEAIRLAGSVQGAQVLLSFNSSIGSNYYVQYTTDLVGGWTNLTNVMAAATKTVCADGVTNSPRRFYRVMKPGN